MHRSQTIMHCRFTSIPNINYVISVLQLQCGENVKVLVLFLLSNFKGLLLSPLIFSRALSHGEKQSAIGIKHQWEEEHVTWDVTVVRAICAIIGRGIKISGQMLFDAMCLALGRVSPPCPSDMLLFLTHQGRTMSNIHLKFTQTSYCEAVSVTSAPASWPLPEPPGFLRKHSTQWSQHMRPWDLRPMISTQKWLLSAWFNGQVHADLLFPALAGTSSQKAFLYRVWLSHESIRSSLESFKCLDALQLWNAILTQDILS